LLRLCSENTPHPFTPSLSPGSCGEGSVQAFSCEPKAHDVSPHQADRAPSSEPALPAQPPKADPRYDELLRLLEEEIADTREEFEYGERVNEERAAVARDASLGPSGEEWKTLLRREETLDRAIDRKVRIVMTLRKEHMRDELPLKFPPWGETKLPKDDFDDDIVSAPPPDASAPGHVPLTPSKSTEQSGNVAENKRPLWKTQSPGQHRPEPAAA
jgi:hypothetical protein